MPLRERQRVERVKALKPWCSKQSTGVEEEGAEVLPDYVNRTPQDHDVFSFRW